MWVKRLLGVIGAAYLGGLVGTFLWQAITGETSDARFPYVFSIFLMLFTIPGTLAVLVIYDLASRVCSGHILYGILVAGAAATGGLMTWTISTGDAKAFIPGAFYGVTTALIWAVIDRRWVVVS